jgi:hypothetical protein
MTAQHGQVEEMIPSLGADRRRSTRANASASGTQATTVATYTDRNSMETYLLAHGYTQTTLNRMSVNDLVYATRLSQDPGGI